MLTSTIAATLAAVIMMLARTAQFAAFFGGGRSNDDREGGNPLVLLAIALLAPIAALVIQMTISRSREYDVDAGGAQLVGSPNGLVNALRKIDSASKQIPMEATPATAATAHLFIIKPFSLSGLFGRPPPDQRRWQRGIRWMRQRQNM
jgi:heat shock protein HtpX